MARRLVEMSKSKMSMLYDKSTSDTKIEEHLEESSTSFISQDDYKKLKQENHILRLKLEASNVFKRDLQTSKETLEKTVELLMQCMSMQEKETKKYRAEEEYENSSANLQTNYLARNEKETIRVQEKLIAKSEEMERLREKIIADYEKDIKRLEEKLEKYIKNVKELKNRLANLGNQYENLMNLSSISLIDDTEETDHN